MEPNNPDRFYEYIGPMELDGKRGKGKIKKWFDDEEKEWKEKVLSFEAEE